MTESTPAETLTAAAQRLTSPPPGATAIVAHADGWNDAIDRVQDVLGLAYTAGYRPADDEETGR